jgi:hypothetical protein
MAGFVSIYLASRRHTTSCDGVRKEKPVVRGEGAKWPACSRQPSRRKADFSTDDDAERGPMSKLRSRGKKVKEDVIHT